MAHPDIPPDWWRRESACGKLSQWFGNHTLALLVVSRRGAEQCCRVFTGFLYRHKGIPLWVSAGHVMKALEELKEQGHPVIHSIWADRSRASPEGDAGVPVDLDTLHPFWIERRGVDLGFVVVPTFYLKLLDANPENCFLDERVWYGKDTARPEGYYLVGFPSAKHDLTTVELSNGKVLNRLQAPLMCLPLERIPDRPGEDPKAFWGIEGAFYGRLVPFAGRKEPPEFSIKYMSGGPILSIERTTDGELLYRWFGVQSSWLPESKVIRATSEDTAVAIIDELYNQARKSHNAGTS